MPDSKSLPLETDKIRDTTPFYSTDKGMIFLTDRMTTFCRTHLVEKHLAHIRVDDRITLPESLLIQKLAASPNAFKAWLHQTDKPSEEDIKKAVQHTFWHDTNREGHPRAIQKFVWAWEDPEDMNNMTWMFGINDFIRMPDKYIRDLKQQNHDHERLLRELRQPRIGQAPLVENSTDRRGRTVVEID